MNTKRFPIFKILIESGCAARIEEKEARQNRWDAQNLAHCQLGGHDQRTLLQLQRFDSKAKSEDKDEKDPDHPSFCEQIEGPKGQPPKEGENNKVKN